MTQPKEDRSGWPILYNELEEYGVSYSAIMILSREKGGTRFTVPKNPNPNHWLYQLIGKENAEVMSYHLGGINIDFPLGPMSNRHQQWQAMRRMDRDGRSYNEIAKECGVNRRTVIRQVKGVLETNQEQPDMFADHHPRPRNQQRSHKAS